MNGTHQNELNVVTEVWQSIVTTIEEAWTAIRENSIAAHQAIKNAITSAAVHTWHGIRWLGRNILLPCAMTGLNIIGYLLDKVLFGSPGLRTYLEKGILPCSMPDAWRDHVRNNGGWDIYESMNTVVDNVIGMILGGGVGIVNIASHFLTSIFRNIYQYSNVLTLSRNSFDDRSSIVKCLFGLLTAPIVVPVIAVTNIFHLTIATIKNTALSCWHNVKSSFNLLGDNGIMGPRHKFDDKREFFTKFFFGLITAPFVLSAITITNVIDVTATTIKHCLLSFWHNVKSSFNLLGENGVMGPRLPHNDQRGFFTKFFFGAATAPFVLPTIAFTNSIDIIAIITKHIALSFWHIARLGFNLLGEDGVMGPRLNNDDQRGILSRLMFGFIAIPFVIPCIIVTNAIDAACAFVKNCALSFWHNTRSLFNLLGEDGIMGPRLPHDDKRGLLAYFVFGTITAPLVLPCIAITNSIDAIGAVIKHIALSFWHNTRLTFNLLGEYGIMGPRLNNDDQRGLLPRFIFGLLSLPLVLPCIAITNLIDITCGYIKNYKHTIIEPAKVISTLAIGITLALPVFMIRKTITGLYNATFRPIVDCMRNKPFTVTRIFEGVLNVATLGGYAAVKKTIKAVTGYSNRFGFAKAEIPQELLAVPNYFTQAQAKFRSAIHLAGSGKFPNVHDGVGMFRVIMKTFYGMHHKVEIILKELHDAYLSYTTSLATNKIQQTDAQYNMLSFFQSSAYLQAEQHIQEKTRIGEEQLLSQVKTYLSAT